MRVVLEYLTSVRGIVFILGKICLIAAVGFAYKMGETLKDARGMEFPEINLKNEDDGSQGKEEIAFSSYSIISQRNIFGKQKTKASPQPTAQAPTSLNFRLVGTNLSPSAGSFAIIENKKDKKQDVFDLGTMVFGQAKLVEVLTESVKLDHNGKIEVLLFEEDAGSGSSGRSSGVESLNDDRTEFSLSEEELSGALANLPRLLSQARAVPYFRNGKSVGMRLFAIRRGSLYEKLGLKNGDIIKAVNENSLTDPAQALKLFEQLKSERSIQVVAERAGQDLDLKYSIR